MMTTMMMMVTMVMMTTTTIMVMMTMAFDNLEVAAGLVTTTDLSIQVAGCNAGR